MSKFGLQQPLILASGSTIRFKLLKSLGLEFLVVPSDCDEEAIKISCEGVPILDLGFTLAKSKALAVSQRFPNHFVIAADQLCVTENKILDKPLQHQTAIKHLQLLRGKKHQQIACICIAKENNIIWQYHDIATLLMRELTDAEIHTYLECDKPYQSCGAYQFETLGKWLFKEVQGQEDTILGLPLLPLANALIDLQAISFL